MKIAQMGVTDVIMIPAKIDVTISQARIPFPTKKLQPSDLVDFW